VIELVHTSNYRSINLTIQATVHPLIYLSIYRSNYSSSSFYRHTCDRELFVWKPSKHKPAPLRDHLS